MSAQFRVEYSGAPVKFTGTQIELVDESQATLFASEAGAWWSAYQAQLAPNQLRVVNLYLENQPAHVARN